MGHLIVLLMRIIWLIVVGIIFMPIWVLSELVFRLFLRKKMNDVMAWDLLIATRRYRHILDNLVSLPPNSPEAARITRESTLLSSGQVLCADISRYEALCGKELQSILNEMRQIESIIKEKINDGVELDEPLLEKFKGLVEESDKHLRPMISSENLTPKP